MEDLDYKDLFRDAIHTIAYIARAAGFDPNDPTVEPPAIVARIETQRADLERLTAALEEARLTLAAEQGRAEGAPSPGWEPCRVDDDGGWGWRKKTADGFLFAQGARVIEPVESEYGLQRHPGGWERWLADSEEFLAEKVAHGLDDTWTARAAMLAADAATEAR